MDILFGSSQLGTTKMNVDQSDPHLYYSGAVIAYNAGLNVVLGIAVCWVALFLPGIMLLFGAMPFWGLLRSSTVYRRCYTMGFHPCDFFLQRPRL